MKLNKLFTTIAAGSLMLALAACGNDSAKDSTSSSDVTSSKIATKKHHSNKDSENAVKAKHGESTGSVDSQSSTKNSSSNSASSNNNSNYSVSSTTTSSDGSSAKSNVKQNSNASSQATMTATDARNIVKEHIGNQLNNRGVAGQSTDDLPSIDSVDSYTATQNGTNNWTVTGNGHTYHVTANSVTGN